jgi:DNA-binding transcriptional ArsR family regulator
VAASASPAPLAALSRARFGLLAMLSEPASTISLASRLGVTPSAVSQHLHALAAADLVTPARVGRTVLYRQTAQGADYVSRGRAEA